MHNLTIKINVSTDYDGSDTLQYTSVSISNSIIDTPTASSSGRVDIIPKNRPILVKVPFFGMVSTLPLELWIGTSMVLSGIVISMCYKVSEQSKSL